LQLVASDLSKSFWENGAQNRVALQGVSFGLDPGLVAVTGPNGSGKSTLLRILAGVLEPSEGQVMFNGEAISSLGPSYRDCVGYLPQQFGFYPQMTGLQFLSYLGQLKGIPLHLLNQRCLQVGSMVGLRQETLTRRRLQDYSGGMKRRLGLAQALLNDPQVLILDEPADNLDPVMRANVFMLLGELAQERIVIVATHVIADLGDAPDSLLILEGGELLGKWSPERALNLVANKVWEFEGPGQPVAPSLEEAYLEILRKRRGSCATPLLPE